MKYILSCLGLLLIVVNSWAQPSPCICGVQLEPVSDCCFNIVASWTPNCLPGQAQANHLRINSAISAPFSANIHSVTLFYPQLSSTLSAGNTLLDINSSSNIANFEPVGDPIVLGSLCYENVSGAVVTSRIDMDNNGINACTSFSENPLSCVTAEPWNKIYGDTLNNVPTKIKAFGDGLYVAGYRVINGIRYGTISKFDITSGALMWNEQHDIPSIYHDIEYSPINQEVIVVGGTENPMASPTPFDNKSLIMRRRSSDGQIPPGGLKEYNHPGREGFLVIKRHPFPEDPDFPFYALGGENPATNAPSIFDQVVAYNFNRNLVSDWDKRYTEINGIEIEGVRGIVPLSDGDVLLLGNGATNNPGVVIKVDGEKGDYLESWYFPDEIDWYDGVHLPNGFVILAGTRFGTDQAILLAVDPVNGMTSFGGMIFQNQSTFRELGFHSLANPSGTNDLYTVAHEKNNPTINRNIINKITFDLQPSTLPIFALDWSRVLEDGENQFADPHLYVRPGRDNVFYADNRTPSPAPFGGTEILAGSYDLNLSSNCMEPVSSPYLGYSVNPVSFIMQSADINLNPVNQSLAAPDLDYECTNYCGGICTADFSWTTDCCTVQFTGSATGIGPFIYEWDFDCGNPFTVDFTGQNPIWGFPGTGTYQVCLRVTDPATGAVCTIQHSLSVVDNPPIMTCPPDTTIPTDPGSCTATYNLTPPTVTDDCTANLFISCQMSGATTGSASTSPVTLNKGITIISYATEDEKGQIADCSYQITVQDQEPPIIECPDPVTASAIFCDGGTNVILPMPIVSDNCPMVEVICSHQSGDFFPCGTTMVTCTAIDMAGNETICTYPVIVECPCAEVDSGEIACTDVNEQFSFSFDVLDLNGTSFGSSCNVNATSSQAGVTVSNVQTSGTSPNYTVTGLVTVSAPPVPTTISLTIDVNCVCPDGRTNSCSFTRVLETPCCKEVTIDPQEVCSNSSGVHIPLQGCGSLYDVQQVRWYFSDGPCPSSGPSTLIKVATTCADLVLSPYLHNDDICVYAEVYLGPDDGPCTLLTTNMATITLCDPIDFTLSSNQAYCWMGTPITPMSLNVTFGTNECLDAIEWFDDQGNIIPSASGQTSYQPPPLIFTLPNTECSQSYNYRVDATNECGTTSKSITIRLDNEDAPVGTLSLLPPDTNPLCYGEDTILEYEPECVGDPEEWDWYRRTASTSYTQLTGNGTRNPLYYTNRLYEDTWVKVEKTNGTCPTDEIELFLDILDPVTINSFTAVYDDICNPSQVTLSVDLLPNPADPGCAYNIFWYRNGQLIGTTTATPATPAFFHYSGLPLDGNYYCIVESNCCPGRVQSQVITLEPEMQVFVDGPCYRCNDEDITLNGIIIHPLSNLPGFTCNYQWYDNGVAIPGETGQNLIVDPLWDGPFTFEVTCSDGSTTCIKLATYHLLQCGIIIETNEPVYNGSLEVYPNPTKDQITVHWEQSLPFKHLKLYDLNGQTIQHTDLPIGADTKVLDLTSLPDGIYLLQLKTVQGTVLHRRIIKQ